MWREYNPNPASKNTGDCTVRAICAVAGLPWRAAHAALCALAREMADMPETNAVWWTFLRGIGFEQIHLPDRCPDCYTVAQFAAEHPRGRFVLGPWQHAVAVVDGDWWDTWDSGVTVPRYYFGGVDNGIRSETVLPAELPAVPDVSAAAAANDAPDNSRGDRPSGQ